METNFWKGSAFGASLAAMAVPGVASLQGMVAGLATGLGITLALVAIFLFQSNRSRKEVA